MNVFGIEFKGAIELRLDLVNTKKYRIEITNKILNEGYYFKGDIYNYNVKTRTLFLQDKSVFVVLNLNLFETNIRHIYFIVSILRLTYYDLISNETADEIISLYLNILSLKVEYVKDRFTMAIEKLVNGMKSDSLYVEITKERLSSTNLNLSLRSVYLKEREKPPT